MSTGLLFYLTTGCHFMLLSLVVLTQMTYPTAHMLSGVLVGSNKLQLSEKVGKDSGQIIPHYFVQRQPEQ
jgi:hypothetical protein